MNWRLLRFTLIIASVVTAAVLLWKLSALLLLVFGSVLVAVLLRSVAGLLETRTPVSQRWSLPLAILAIALLLAGFVAVLGTQLSAQTAELLSRVPEILQRFEELTGITRAEEWIKNRAEDLISGGGLATSIAGYSSLVLGALANVLLVVVAGIYLAARPKLYRDGFLMLFPREKREEADDTLQAVGAGLKLWLAGQIAAMLMVGCLATLGLWLLGVPSALALGFIAGLLEFVPFVGPFLSAAPAIALALGQSPITALWVAGLYLAIQQLEGILITPLIQQRTVDLPPALAIFAIVAFGTLFGPLGILFATPLAVVTFIATKKLWVRDVLAEETDLPGEAEH